MVGITRIIKSLNGKSYPFFPALSFIKGDTIHVEILVRELPFPCLEDMPSTIKDTDVERENLADGVDLILALVSYDHCGFVLLRTYLVHLRLQRTEPSR